MSVQPPTDYYGDRDGWKVRRVVYHSPIIGRARVYYALEYGTHTRHIFRTFKRAWKQYCRTIELESANK